MAINTRKIKDFSIRMLIYICAAFSVFLVIGIIIYVLMKGLSAVNWSFLTSVTSVLKGTVGIAGNIVNTILIIFISMVIATPIGVGSAIYLNEYAKPGKVVTLIEYATETLSGINSFLDKNCKMDMSFLEPASQTLSVPLNLPDSEEKYLLQIRSRVYR